MLAYPEHLEDCGFRSWRFWQPAVTPELVSVRALASNEETEQSVPNPLRAQLTETVEDHDETPYLLCSFGE